MHPSFEIKYLLKSTITKQYNLIIQREFHAYNPIYFYSTLRGRTSVGIGMATPNMPEAAGY